jgi:hypothetical protein
MELCYLLRRRRAGAHVLYEIIITRNWLQRYEQAARGDDKYGERETKNGQRMEE